MTELTEDPTGDGEYTMLTFAQSMGLQWGKADLLAVGPDDGLKRAAELAAYFAIAGNADGSRRASGVWVIIPPVAVGAEGETLGRLQIGFAETLAIVSHGQASEAIVDEAFRFISPRIVPNFDGDDLMALLAKIPAETAVIVVEAGRFRLSGTKLPDAPRLEESVVAAHAHQLLVEVDALSGTSGCYIVLDMGVYAPSRQADLDLLQSVGDTGFVAGGGARPDPDAIVANVSRWIEAVKSGNIGSVIREIESDASLSERQRFFLKLEAYSTAGLPDLVRSWLRDNDAMLVDLPADQALHVARIAETADEDDYAHALLTAAVPHIRSEGDFENALTTALAIRNAGLKATIADAFRRLYPNAAMLKRLAVVEAAKAGRYAEAAELLAATADDEATADATYYTILARGTTAPDWDPQALHVELVQALPNSAGDGGFEIARKLDHDGRRGDAIAFLVTRSAQITGSEVTLLVALVSNALQAAAMKASDPAIEQVVDLSIAYLAAHPSHGRVRTKLADLMGPSLTAGRGQGILMVAAMKRAQTLPAIRARPKIDERPSATDLREALPRIQHIWRWLHERGHGMWQVGQHPLPADQLDLPADQLIASILLQVDFAGNRVAEAADLDLLNLYLAAACAIAPLSPEPDEDLTIVRTVASKLAIAGKGQAARDLAEFAVTAAGDRPERHRQALFTFADIYARLGMRTEALVALCAALETSAIATWDQIWFETNLLFRMLRDVGAAELGLPLLGRSQQALEELGLAERDGYRIETMGLQVATSEFERQSGTDSDLRDLIRLAEDNAAVVIERSDDPLPVAMVLNRLLDIVEERLPDAVPSIQAVLDRIIMSLPEPQQAMIRAAGLSPTLVDIAQVAHAIEAPRYADDAGYDLRQLRMMTRRLVGEAVADVDPKTLIYAVEASADRAIAVRSPDGTKIEVERLLSRDDAPIEAARDLSRLGAAVVGMALFDGQLATIEFEEGEASDVTLERPETFSSTALARWSQRFPRDYSLEDKCLDREQVRGSVIDLGLTKLPPRAIMIADAELQRFPPNMLTIDGNYAGFGHAIGVAPSLEWLTASRKLDRKGNGSCRAWIPVSPPGVDIGPLTLMADEVAPILDAHDAVLEGGSTPSAQFGDADVAVIGAHGGLAEVNRYFRSLSNDEHGVTDIADLAEATRLARLTILFVCSGGRIDPHPETGMAIGLAKRILARGCSAVIAPAWPIPFFVARPWLDGFLTAWRRGEMVVDACHQANLAVAAATSWDPKRSLAMALYGDPFIHQ